MRSRARMSASENNTRVTTGGGAEEIAASSSISLRSQAASTEGVFMRPGGTGAGAAGERGPDALEFGAEFADSSAHLALFLAHLGEFAGTAAELELGHDMPAENAQCALLILAQCARDVVDDAERAERVAVRSNKGRAGVEADARLAGHQRVVGKALVFERVGNDEEVLVQNGVRAEGNFAGGFLGGDADLGLEPLTVLVHEADHGNGSFADAGGELGEVVEDLFGDGIHDVILPEDFQAFLFVGWERDDH